MKIEIKDLEVGDEILISVNSKMQYLKVLEKPRISKKRVHWRTKNPLYINVKCSTSIEGKSYSYMGWGNQLRTYKYIEYKLTDKDHNVIKKYNLNDRVLWLVRRSEII